MDNDYGQQAREAAARFGDKVEDAFDDLGQAKDALDGDRPVEPPSQDDDDGGGVTINVNT